MNVGELQSAIDMVMYILDTKDLEDSEYNFQKLDDAQRVKLAKGMIYPYTSRGQANR